MLTFESKGNRKRYELWFFFPIEGVALDNISPVLLHYLSQKSTGPAVQVTPMQVWTRRCLNIRVEVVLWTESKDVPPTISPVLWRWQSTSCRLAEDRQRHTALAMERLAARKTQKQRKEAFAALTNSDQIYEKLKMIAAEKNEGTSAIMWVMGVDCLPLFLIKKKSLKLWSNIGMDGGRSKK